MNSLHLTALLLMGPSAPPGTESTAPGWTSLIPLLVLMALMFLLFRSSSRRQKEHDKLVAAIDTGDEVITTGGILGTVTNRKEKTLTIRIADNVKIEVLRSAIQSVTKPDGKTTSAP